MSERGAVSGGAEERAEDSDVWLTLSAELDRPPSTLPSACPLPFHHMFRACHSCGVPYDGLADNTCMSALPHTRCGLKLAVSSGWCGPIDDHESSDVR